MRWLLFRVTACTHVHVDIHIGYVCMSIMSSRMYICIAVYIHVHIQGKELRKMEAYQNRLKDNCAMYNVHVYSRCSYQCGGHQ